MKILFALAAVFMISAPAFARDSSHFVCSGFMASEPGPDNYGISVQLDEARAGYDDARKEMLSSVWVGSLYQGIRINENNGVSFAGKIVLADKNNSQEVFFDGTYKLVQDTKGNYSLKLDGQLQLSPKDPAFRKAESISTSLPCVNISN